MCVFVCGSFDSKLCDHSPVIFLVLLSEIALRYPTLAKAFYALLETLFNNHTAMVVRLEVSCANIFIYPPFPRGETILCVEK